MLSSLRMVSQPTALLLAGGIGLGAYQAGAYDALHDSNRVEIISVSGSSIGAINGAIIAGNPPELRIAKLRAFWDAVTTEIAPAPWIDPFGLAERGPWRHMLNWINTLTTRSVGSRNLFRLRNPGSGPGEGFSFYDNSPTSDTLRTVVDFNLLNEGRIRFRTAVTDVETGEALWFDTGRGDRIEVEHLLASCGLMPAFEPVRMGGRLLGDGGFSANVPLEAELGQGWESGGAPFCIVIDLFAPDGEAPLSLERAAERARDLFLSLQTLRRLEGLRREWLLRAALAEVAEALSEEARARTDLAPALALGRREGADVFYLSYRAPVDEAGSEKQYDFSRATLGDRYAAGVADAALALQILDRLGRPGRPGLRIHRIRR